MTNRHALTIAISLLASSSLAAATGHAASTSECPELSGQYICQRIADEAMLDLTVQQKKRTSDNSIQYSFRYDAVDTTLDFDTRSGSYCSKRSELTYEGLGRAVAYVRDGSQLGMYVARWDSEFELAMVCNRVGKAKAK